MPKPTEVSIVSGYFNPLHVGHLDMMEAARSLTGYLVVIVNNDTQQVLKKGKVIQPLDHRLRIVEALRVADDAIASTDQDGTVKQSLAIVRERQRR
jgi:cytidyltransferase-like protein